jgi:hypothetical protein
MFGRSKRETGYKVYPSRYIYSRKDKGMDKNTRMRPDMDMKFIRPPHLPREDRTTTIHTMTDDRSE